MLWFKSFHIVFVVAYFAGLFYLPRLFVYHADATDAISHERFVTMEGRLLKLTRFAGVAAIVLGVLTLWTVPAFLSMGWMHAKLALVVLLIGYEHMCAAHARTFRENRNRRSAKWFRVFNEVPALLLVAIVVLVVVKPF